MQRIITGAWRYVHIHMGGRGLRKHHWHYPIDIEATSILKNRPSKQAGGLPESLEKMHELSAGKFPGPSMMFPGGAGGGVLDGASTATEMDESAFSIPNIAPYLVFNPQIILYSSQPASKRWVLQAIMQSIREVSFRVIVVSSSTLYWSLCLGINRLLNLLLNARWPLQLFLHVNLSPKIWPWNRMKTRCVKRLIGWLRI